MGAFEEADLPAGEHPIGLKWVFAHKTDSVGVNILGKEKAQLVAQGFNQCPGQFNETYAPVAKMTSVQVLLAWAAVQDLKIYQFDCKTAFLHTKICHPIYACQIPGYPHSNSKKVLHILVTLYGLHQSAFEFYPPFLFPWVCFIVKLIMVFSLGNGDLLWTRRYLCLVMVIHWCSMSLSMLMMALLLQIRCPCMLGF